MLFPMALTWRMAAIVVIGVFLASFVDGVAGGGGIISVPTYFLAGLPAHLALGTNKLSSGIGTVVSTLRFIRGGFVNWRLAIPSVALALYGSHLGTRLQLALEARVPGLTRDINLRSASFNEQYSKGPLLIEAGAAGCTLEEAMTAVDLLSDALIAEIRGEE